MSEVTEKKVYTNRSAHLVKSVREKFLKEYEAAKELFDEIEVEKVKNDDWYVKRYLLARNKNEKSALRMLIEALKWRKSENFRSLTPQSFPEEFWKLGAIFTYNPDKEGNDTIYMRIKFLLRIPEIAEEAKKFGSFVALSLDEENNGKGITAVVDFKDCGMQNVELEVLRYSVNSLIRYCPAGLKHILVVDLPAIFRAFWFPVKRIIPSKKLNVIQMVTRDNIKDYIEPQNLPKFLGGTCDRSYKGEVMVPPNCITAFEMGIKKGVPVERCDEITALYQPFLQCED